MNINMHNNILQSIAISLPLLIWKLFFLLFFVSVFSFVSEMSQMRMKDV